MLSHINITMGRDGLHLLIDKAVLYAVSLPGEKDRSFIFVTVFNCLGILLFARSLAMHNSVTKKINTVSCLSNVSQDSTWPKSQKSQA